MRLSILVLSVLAFTACATGTRSDFSLSDAEISAMAAVRRLKVNVNDLTPTLMVVIAAGDIVARDKEREIK
ncbi:hypothetical protein ACYULU_06915 [Breznakiellaceae bacterium SP9]